MSDDVNKDIKKAVQDAKNIKSSNTPSSPVKIPSPITLKHSIDEKGVIIPSPTYLKDGKDSK